MNQILDLWKEASLVWEKGGILMPILSVLSLYTYYIAFDLWFRLRTITPVTFNLSQGKNGVHFWGVVELIESCIIAWLIIRTQGNSKRFQQVRSSDSSYLNRRLRFLLVLATASPLIGLLGTVEACFVLSMVFF